MLLILTLLLLQLLLQLLLDSEPGKDFTGVVNIDRVVNATKTAGNDVVVVVIRIDDIDLGMV